MILESKSIFPKDYQHGGDVYSAASELGCSISDLLDFSANIMPFGISDDVREAIIGAIDNCCNYPDPNQSELRHALSLWHNIDEDQIVCGNGAADVLFRAIKTLSPAKVLLPVPTFLEYEKACRENGCEVIHFPLSREKNFSVDNDLLDWLEKETTDLAKTGSDNSSNEYLLILCQPNNPTGLLIDPEILKKILQKCNQLRINVLLDECFLDFLNQEASEEHSAMFLLRENNLLADHFDSIEKITKSVRSEITPEIKIMILRSMTKFYSMPGLRVGYICTDAKQAAKIANIGQPWPLGTLAEAAALKILAQDMQQRRQTNTMIQSWLGKEQKKLVTALVSCGFEVWEPSANYIFFQAKNLPDLATKLLNKKILIRSCANYPGLGTDYFRIAVRSPEENDQFIKSLIKL